MHLTIPITFITPCFCRGADCSENGAPEIRPPSIRGQLHWWFRAIGGGAADENAIFGNVHGGTIASPLVVRVRAPFPPQTQLSPTLPHKQGGKAASKKALTAGTTFDLLLSWRRNPSDSQKRAFSRALDAWLLLGALGLRATRGGGNFTWKSSTPAAAENLAAAGSPATPADYAAAIAQITTGTPLRAALLNQNHPTAEAARRDITDTLGGEGILQHSNYPLGKVFNGRKTSPLRFRVVQFAPAHFQIAAIWDGRQRVTGNTFDDFRAAIRLLATANKRIGAQLADTFQTRLPMQDRILKSSGKTRPGIFPTPAPWSIS
jgi:hypothetical protein